MHSFIVSCKKTVLITLACILLCGCGAKPDSLVCPYSDVAWETSPEQLTGTKGDPLSTYDSTYGGLTYTYGGSYLEREGTLKYMYDADNSLKSIAWAYSADTDELLTVYETIRAEVEAKHGESGYNTNSIGNYGDVWKTDAGSIILSVMITDTNKALQIAYVNQPADAAQ